MADVPISGLSEVAPLPDVNGYLAYVYSNDGGMTYLTRKIQVDVLVAALMYDEVVLKVINHDKDLETGAGQMYFTVPESLNGCSLVSVEISVYTPGSSGDTIVDVNKNGVSVMSTRPSLPSGVYNTYLGGTSGVVSSPSLAQGDRISIDVDSVSSGTKGLDVTLRVKKL